MDLDAAALRTMRAIAQAGSISGAARLLGTSQPAISQQVHPSLETSRTLSV